MYITVHVCVDTKKSKADDGVFLYHHPTITIVSWDRVFHGYWSFPVKLNWTSASSRDPLVFGIRGMCRSNHYMGSRNQTQVLMFAWQTLYEPSHLTGFLEVECLPWARLAKARTHIELKTFIAPQEPPGSQRQWLPVGRDGFLSRDSEQASQHLRYPFLIMNIVFLTLVLQTVTTVKLALDTSHPSWLDPLTTELPSQMDYSLLCKDFHLHNLIKDNSKWNESLLMGKGSRSMGKREA